MIYFGILFVVVLLIAFSVGVILGLRYSSVETIRERQLSMKHLELFKIAVKWIKNQDKIIDYVNKYGYKKIGIYGMSYLGDCLADALEKKGIEVICGIDKNAQRIYNPHVSIYHIEDEFPIPDVIIITVVNSYSQIKHDLENKLKGKAEIISLEQILYS